MSGSAAIRTEGFWTACYNFGTLGEVLDPKSPGSSPPAEGGCDVREDGL
jgi:hypothetical protein